MHAFNYMKNIFLLKSVVLIIILSFSILYSQTIVYDGFKFEDVDRDYIVFLPQNFGPDMPVVFNFHGGLEQYQAQWHMEYTLMNDVADTAGFIVVYPYSIVPYWNVNVFGSLEPEVDDIGFISALIDTLRAKYDIDLNRVYCAGGFLGGTMAHHVISQIGYRFAAGAAVIAPLGTYTAAHWNLTRPIPILMCYGTHDPELPWDGSREGFTSPEFNLDFWIQKNGCTLPADTISLPDIVISDSCTVERISLKSCDENAEILFYKVINGGHSWPGACCDYEWGDFTNRDININVEIWNFVKRFQLIPMAYAKNVSLHSTYIEPGTDTLRIKTVVDNPNENNLSVLALLESWDGGFSDSCYLLDDGNHNDDAANDNIWGGSWPASAQEKTYKVNIKTISLDENQYTLSYDNNVPDFVTTGPLVYSGWTPYILEDSIPNPGDLLSFKIYLTNAGRESTIEDVEARLSTNDARITIHNFYSTYGNITAGSTVESGQGYSIQLSSDFAQDTVIHLNLFISSNGVQYWNDVMPMEIITGIWKNEQQIPNIYALKQNHPNPFNPITVISYQIPTVSFVELSIYNLIGQKIVTLISEKQNSGFKEITWDASGFSSGIYYYKIEAGEFYDVKKMILLR